MSKVNPFPFERLPQFTLEEVLLKKKLFSAYQHIASQPRILKKLSEPLVEILGNDIDLKVTHVEANDFDNVAVGFSENTLLGLVRLEPQGKKAAIVFESLLAKLLISKILSKDTLTPEKLTQLQLKPLTVLEESVVQYILVSLIEKISSNFSNKNFTLSYESVLRSKEQFKSSFSHQEQFAVFSIKLRQLERDFYLKLILPISVADDLESTSRDNEFISQRIRQFENIKTDFQLEIGWVTLEPEDIDALSPGDIIIFDEMLVKKEGDKLKGKAEMKQTTSDSTEGYLVEIESKESSVRAKIESML